jgi:hypothetical protein
LGENPAAGSISSKQTIMKDEAEDQSVLNVIQQLAAEEHRLYEHEALTDADRARLTKINIEVRSVLGSVAAASGFAGRRT